MCSMALISYGIHNAYSSLCRFKAELLCVNCSTGPSLCFENALGFNSMANMSLAEDLKNAFALRCPR